MNSKPTFQVFFTDVVFPAALKRITHWLNVTNSPDPLPALPNTFTCVSSLLTDPTSQTNQTGDLRVFPTFVDSPSSNYLISSAPCFANESDKRPRIGVLLINLPNIAILPENVEAIINHTIHELLHLLLFTPQIYLNAPNSLVKNITKNNKNLYVFNSQSLLDYGRFHFNCSTFDGMPAEDEDDTSMGNHFEKIFAGNELMTAMFTARPVISRMTMAIFEDSGWYVVNHTMAEPNMWGKNAGCSFMNGDCNPALDEFCSSEKEISCSDDYRFKAVCQRNTFSNGCFLKSNIIGLECAAPYALSITVPYEEKGANSRCYVTKNKDVLSSGCFLSYCSDDLKRVYLVTPKSTYVCKASMQIAVGNLTIFCPDPADFCFKTDMNRCLDDCNGRGRCLYNSVCRCDYLWEGDSCQFVKKMSKLSTQIAVLIRNVTENVFDVTTLANEGVIGIIGVILLMGVAL